MKVIFVVEVIFRSRLKVELEEGGGGGAHLAEGFCLVVNEDHKGFVSKAGIGG